MLRKRTWDLVDRRSGLRLFRGGRVLVDNWDQALDWASDRGPAAALSKTREGARTEVADASRPDAERPSVHTEDLFLPRAGRGTVCR